MGDRSSIDSAERMLVLFLAASDDVHRYISKLTGGDQQLTEDVVQETFVTLLRRHQLGDDTPVQVGWLMTTARHRLIDHVRSRQRDQARVERHVAGTPLDEPAIDVGSVSSEQALWMLAQLPLGERLALVLHTVDGMSVAEVAAELNRSLEATTSLLARARRRLRTLTLEVVHER